MTVTSISPAQCRGARAMLQWSLVTLASEAKIARTILAAFENEKGALNQADQQRLKETLEQQGLEFINGERLGVVMKPAQGRKRGAM